MTTKARSTTHETAFPTRHDTFAATSVLAAIVLTILYGVIAPGFDPVGDTTAVAFKESRHV